MLTRILAATAFSMLCASGAIAGTLQNGVWTPNCTAPGDAPTISSKSAAAYNSSAKEAQAWQEKVKAFADCLNAEAKADQSTVVSTANDSVKKVSDQITALSQQSSEAVEKLKKSNK